MSSLRSSAAYRIAFTYSAAFALAIVVLGVIVYFAADANFRTQLDSRIADESSEVAAAFHDRDIKDLHEAISRREAGALAKTYGYALFDRRSGKRLWGSLRTVMPPTGFHDIVFYEHGDSPDGARALATDLPDDLRVVVSLDPEELEQFEQIIFELFSAAFALMVILGIVGGLLLGGYLQRRLSRVSRTAQAIVTGDLDRRVPVSPRGDEFDQLALALNTMLDRIAQLMDNLRRVSSDVAHDLRTPLARLRSQLEEALDGPREADVYRDGLKRGLAQSDHLLALFAAILRISEIEAGALRRMFARVDISDLARDLGESYAPAVSDGGRTLICTIASGLALNGDRELLAQALINLLDNAQRHTPPGTVIHLSATHEDTMILLSVADDGCGVAAEDRERIVGRFARLDTSRGTPGHGLGLNLVSAIATAHAGRLTIEDNDPGLRVTLVLPRLP
jgi:signal transduction histidine kinase